MYFDDTTLYCDIDKYCHLNQTWTMHTLEILNNWFKINKLSLDAEKTRLMFSRKNKPTTINFNNVQITEFSFFNFLGIMFNNEVT